MRRKLLEALCVLLHAGLVAAQSSTWGVLMAVAGPGDRVTPWWRSITQH